MFVETSNKLPLILVRKCLL